MRYQLFNKDAFQFLREIPKQDAIVVGLPDLKEMSYSLMEYERWYVNTIRIILNSVKEDGYLLVTATSSKNKGALIDKSFLINTAAKVEQARTLFHKIILRRDPDKVDLFRSGYKHLICISKKGSSGKARPDVLGVSDKLYKNAVSNNEAELIVSFLKEKGIKTLCDPFCGQAAVLSIALREGFSVIGNDLDPDQYKKANELLTKTL